MKKIILLLFTVLLCSVCTPMKAQDKSYTLDANTWYQTVPALGNADTVTNHDTLYSVQYLVNKVSPVKVDARIKLTKVSGNPRVLVKVQGKKFDSASWADVSSMSATWYATTTDTTIYLTQVTTAQYYRYLRVYFDANTTAQKSKVSAVEVKFWDK